VNYWINRRFNCANETGCQILLEDPHSEQLYSLKVAYFDYNWMPAYGSHVLEKVANRMGDRSEMMIGYRSNVVGNKPIISNRIAIRDQVMFERVNSSAADTKTMYRLLAFSNEIIGCPPILCYNPTLDAANYNYNSKKYQYFRGTIVLAFRGERATFNTLSSPCPTVQVSITGKWPNSLLPATMTPS
jgi:hypothetical protein